jgi:hypothetical protein
VPRANPESRGWGETQNNREIPDRRALRAVRNDGVDDFPQNIGLQSRALAFSGAMEDRPALINVHEIMITDDY